MNLADVFTFLFVILGFLIVYVGYWLMAFGLFPGMTQRCSERICAAPVKVCIEYLKKGMAQGIVVNSGNANACTGPQGLKDAKDLADLLTEARELLAIFTALSVRISVSIS